MRLLLLSLVVWATIASAQTAQDKQEIMAPIGSLLQALNIGDSTKVYWDTMQGAMVFTVTTDDNRQPTLSGMPIDRLLDEAATSFGDDARWNEHLWNIKFQMDGDLAQVWAKYAFYVGKELRHCGSDAFLLYKVAKGEWRIFQKAQTVQKEGCNVPPHIAEAMR